MKISDYSWATHKVVLNTGFSMYFDGIDEVKYWMRKFNVKPEDAEIKELKEVCHE